MHKLISSQQVPVLALDKEILGEVLSELGLSEKFSVDDFEGAGCDQSNIVLIDAELPPFTDVESFFFKSPSELTQSSFSSECFFKNVASLYPYFEPIKETLDKFSKTFDAKSYAYGRLAEGPGINSEWHVDFFEMMRDDFFELSTLVLTLLPKEQGASTRYVDYNGVIEIPRYNSPEDHGGDLRDFTRLLDGYVKALLVKYNLKEAYLPPNKWALLPRMFLHSSPPFNALTASPRIFLATLFSSRVISREWCAAEA